MCVDILTYKPHIWVHCYFQYWFVY